MVCAVERSEWLSISDTTNYTIVHKAKGVAIEGSNPCSIKNDTPKEWLWKEPASIQMKAF